MTRIEREKAVIDRMIHIYCHSRHKPAQGRVCEDCAALLAYARHRLSLCPFGEGKSSCRKCRIHCYSPDNREKIREVMRYVGPRMLFYHPLAALRHLYDELK